MLNIYADTFMTATRTRCVRLREMPTAGGHQRRRWFSRPPEVCVDLEKL